jgi:hypothetical protein
MAGMPELFLGMSVVCPDMSGCICTPEAFYCTKNKFWRVCRRYVWVCPWYVRVYLYPRGALLHKKRILAGMPDKCLGMLVACPGMSGYPRLYLLS